MNVKDIKKKLLSQEYNFLRTNEILNNNIILLGLGGSYAYGTNNENSDLDIRGIATNTKRNILIGDDFEQVVSNETDTVVYSFDKIIRLFCSCNPNTIEILGLKPEHYLYISPIGQALLDNKTLFLSKAATHSFGGYATAQLYRLNQKAVHQMPQPKLEEHILKVMKSIEDNFSEKFSPMPNDGIKLYISKSEREDYETEIFMDVNLSNYPLRDYCSMWNELQNVTKQYNKIGKRNSHAIEHNKIAKHMCHLVRLYLMCFDILEKGEINTFREKEHDLLMDIRNGKFLDENGQPTKEFYDMVDVLENQLNYLKEHTDLPERVDMNRINDFVAKVNEIILSDDKLKKFIKMKQLSKGKF